MNPNANRVEVIYQQNAYVYDVVKRYLDANGNEVDAVIHRRNSIIRPEYSGSI